MLYFNTGIYLDFKWMAWKYYIPLQANKQRLKSHLAKQKPLLIFLSFPTPTFGSIFPYCHCAVFLSPTPRGQIIFSRWQPTKQSGFLKQMGRKNKSAVPLPSCMYMCIRVYVLAGGYACACARAYTCTWRSEASLGCHCLGTITLVVSETVSLVWKQPRLLCSTGWLPTPGMGFTCLHLPSSGNTNSQHHMWLFSYGFWGLNVGLHACAANTVLTEPSP